MSPSASAYLSTRNVGDTEMTLILEGSGPYPVELNVPEEVWRPAVPDADADANITLYSGGAFLRHGAESIVVDPGLDDPGTPTFEAAKGVFKGWSFTPGFQAGLSTLGVSNDSVTHVVVTHAHFDHCLGVTVAQNGGQLPRFPNARDLLDRADWNLHFEPDGTMRPVAASPFSSVTIEMRERLQVIMQAGLLDLVEGDVEVVPGLTLVPTPGETPGHRAIRIESDGASCWHLGDLVHYAVEFEHIDWLTPTRRDASAITASRKRVLPQVVAENALVTWSHAKFPGWGRIIGAGGGYRWRPLE
ncbi:MAG TPA: MBL fold metallo-hydrolase [Thermomicrobiales bacterium]|nr:MBL fold metallo-hydrolase [Thermomicrobiales bacterium]